MNYRKRLLSVLAIVVVAAAMVTGAILFTADEEGVIIDWHKETITLWYTDDSLTDYLSSRALAFYDATDIRVEPVLVSGLEYLEAINSASISEEETTPDVYIVSNDSLEKAYLAGLAYPIEDTSRLDDSALFCDAARNAITYQGKYIGYPFYYETAALLYNRTYLEQIAAEASQTDAEEAQTEDDAEQTDTEETQTGDDAAQTDPDTETIDADALIPTSIVDIVTCADEYSAPENVEYFLRWDVSDIFYNYFFIGNYITVGGASGDDKEQIDIYNTESIASLKVYQEMNQFFSIDPDETSYDTILQEFLDGKTIFTIATSDCLQKLDEAEKNGEFTYEYGITKLPDINEELTTKGMSVTNVLAVNGYSEHKDAAEQLVEYLACEETDDLYTMTGKLSALTPNSAADERMAAFAENYEASVPIPKMIETSNFWVELEICFAKVWDGEDANTEIRTLSEQIKTQLAGEAYTEEVLDDPEVELLPDSDYEDDSGNE